MKKRFVFFVLMFAFFNAMGRNQAQAATGVPGAPTAFTVTPDAGGALSAVLNWKNPAVTAAGDPLDSISFIVVRRDGKELTKIEKPNPGVAGTYTDTKPERGNHIYTVRAYNSKGDGIYAFKEAFTGGTYPCAVPLSAETYVEDFEDPTRYPCTIIYCEPTSESRFNEWGIKNGSPNEAHTGTGFAFSSGGMNPTKEGWLILPKVSLPAGKIYNMTFWSYNLYPDRYYKNSVLISDGSVFPEGGDYKEVWSPASVTEPWTQSEINLSDYAGKEVYIAFRYSANYWWCNSWYLDDIVFKEAPIADAGITAIINPVTGALTGTEPVTIKVKNIGSQKLTDIPVKAEIDNSLVLSGKIDSLAIGEEKNYTFAQTIDCSVLKRYAIKAYTALSNDGNRTNDTISVTLTNIGDCSVSTFPYIEDFEEEGALQCWKIYRYGDIKDTIQWKRTTVYSHSEKHSFYHNTPPVDETVKKDGWLISPKMRIPADGAYLLSFWSFNEFPDFYGKNSVWISNGSSDPSDGKFKEIWTTASISKDWREARINLASYTGDSIYIAFRYEGMYSHRWYIDDVKIERLPDKDLGITAIVSPVSGDNLTASEPAIIRVRNYGSRAQSNIPVKIEMDSISLSGTVPSLAVNSEVEYKFTGTLNLSEEKSYSLRASISLEGDVNNSNDTIWQTATNHGNLAVMGSRSPVTTCDISFVADGIERDYRMGKETQMMTFYPATSGNKIKAQFTHFVTYPDWVDKLGIKYHGDSLFVYNGNKVDASKQLAAIAGYKTASDMPKPFTSTEQDGSLTFVFKKLSNNMSQGYEGDLGWHIKITCASGLNVESIDSEQGKVYAVGGKLYASGFKAGAVATVYNALGQKVLTHRIKADASFSDKLHPGIYVINVQLEKEQKHFKVLIK